MSEERRENVNRVHKKNVCPYAYIKNCIYMFDENCLPSFFFNLDVIA